MIQLENLYSFMEGNFEFLIAVDSNEKIIHVSPLLAKHCEQNFDCTEGTEKYLSDILTDNSLKRFREAMLRRKSGSHGIRTLFETASEKVQSIPMKTGYAQSVHGGIFLFFGRQVDGLQQIEDWEKEERIKELSCLYSIADWIEVSPSIEKFFIDFPNYLSRGMRFPEEVLVHSEYNGDEYGQKPEGDDYIGAKLVVGGEIKGKINVGYIAGAHELLLEEQKMLDEICRMLSLALERKGLSERMELKQEEEAEYTRRLSNLEEEIETRTEELERQKEKLGTATSYLDRINRSWDETQIRLETMFQAIPGEVMLIDLKHNVVMSNRENLVPGEKCYKTFFDRTTPCENCRLTKIRKKKVPITITLRDGDRYLEVNALPIYDKTEEVDGIIEFYRDATLEKTYEQQIQQADKLASLGQLVSGIGHEINNPNQFIRGNIKIVKQAITDMIPIIDTYYETHPDLKIARLKYNFFREHIMTLVDDMSHGSERIKGIVEGLRGFARKDEGLLIDAVDVNTLLEATTRLVKNEVHKHAEIELHLAKNIKRFSGNSQKIEQIFVNLIVNASQAISDERKGLITVTTEMDDETVVIKIADNGKGMDARTLRQIFDPFFTTKRAKGGTGLGLAIAYRIVEEHSGTISVNSEPGEGTEFIIRIPALSDEE